MSSRAVLSVVIDALNVARDRSFPEHADGHGGSAIALQRAIDHFLQLGRSVYAIMPAWALDGGTQRRERSKLAHVEVLQPYLHKQLHISPAGVDCDDFILRVAMDQDALVLTNDLFRDHIARGVVSREWVRERRVSYMFVNGQLLVLGEPPSPVARGGGPLADGSRFVLNDTARIHELRARFPNRCPAPIPPLLHSSSPETTRSESASKRPADPTPSGLSTPMSPTKRASRRDKSPVKHVLFSPHVSNHAGATSPGKPIAVQPPRRGGNTGPSMAELLARRAMRQAARSG